MSAILDVPIQAIQGLLNYFPKKEIETQTVLVKEVIEKMSLPAQGFVRLAGLSGGLAIGMAAYARHAFKRNTEDGEKRYITFEAGNKMHIVHSLALLAVPLTRRPLLVGSTMTAGMALFCGSTYYSGMTGDTRVRWITPYGGVLLILAWFAMML